MLNVPEQLKQMRFLRVGHQAKIPLDNAWQKTANYDHRELIDNHAEGNYGILTGWRELLVIDIDDERALPLLKQLPDTFKVRTGSGGTHAYFLCADFKKKVVMTREGVHYGECQWKGQFVVGPNSIHPNGNKYEVTCKEPVAKVTSAQVMQAIAPFCDVRKLAETQAVHETRRLAKRGGDLQISDVLKATLFSMKFGQHPEYQGKNPWHGSTTGKNFSVNVDKNVGFCHRCNVGVSPWKALALNHGIVTSCDEEVSDAQFRQLLDIAKREGLIQESDKVSDTKATLECRKMRRDTTPPYKGGVSQEVSLDALPFKVWTVGDVLKAPPAPPPLMDELIPSGEVIMLWSPPGSYKSLLSLAAACCISRGHPLLGFKTRKAQVLYIDLENSLATLRERYLALRRGFGWHRRESSLLIIQEMLLFADRALNPLYREGLFKAVDQHNPELIVIDTVRRLGGFREDSADDVNLLYVEVLKKLRDTGKTVIFLHHSQKGAAQYRGSVDLLGCVDTSYELQKVDDGFTLRTQKSRNGRIAEVYGRFTFGDDSISLERTDTAPLKPQAKRYGTLDTDIVRTLGEHQPMQRRDLDVAMRELHGDTLPRRTVDRRLAALETQGIVVSYRKGEWSLTYHGRPE